MTIQLVDVYNGQDPHPWAVGLLYLLLKERPPEANISHTEMPSFWEHEAYVKRRPYRAWFIVLNDYDQKVGALSLTHHNEIGISILKNYHRQGYALAAIEIAKKIPPLPAKKGERRGTYVANIAPDNEASHRLFLKAGARPIQVTYEV